MFGKITREFTVWCVCGYWEQYGEPTKTQFIKYVQSLGWKKVCGRWNCPKCVARGVIDKPESER